MSREAKYKQTLFGAAVEKPAPKKRGRKPGAVGPNQNAQSNTRKLMEAMSVGDVIAVSVATEEPRPEFVRAELCKGRNYMVHRTMEPQQDEILAWLEGYRYANRIKQ